MHSTRHIEHYVTLFDHKFLLAGLCLYESLKKHASPFALWILCVDEIVEKQLRELALADVKLIPLREVEDDGLKRVRKDRTAAEYCWTLTPFAPSFVMEREPGVGRVTYLDADLYFFEDPQPFFDEFDQGGGHVLITEHGYAPEYDQSATSGIYCVQFLTFKNTPAARKILNWWQGRCVEWCHARFENGKFGDQKYLDDWPSRFGTAVHVLSQKDRILAPWNVAYVLDQRRVSATPVFFHFHGFRVISCTRMLLYRGYGIGCSGQWLYDEYCRAMTAAMALVLRRWQDVPILPERRSIIAFVYRVLLLCFGRIRYRRVAL